MELNTNALIALTLSLRAIPPWRESVAISLHKLRLLRHFIPRKDNLFNAFVLVTRRDLGEEKEKLGGRCLYCLTSRLVFLIVNSLIHPE
jgi:hypothetical protein